MLKVLAIPFWSTRWHVKVVHEKEVTSSAFSDNCIAMDGLGCIHYILRVGVRLKHSYLSNRSSFPDRVSLQIVNQKQWQKLAGHVNMRVGCNPEIYACPVRGFVHALGLCTKMRLNPNPMFDQLVACKYRRKLHLTLKTTF